jgi:predicted RNA methylase
MSAKGVSKKRTKLPGDPYYTPRWAVRQCLIEVVGHGGVRSILEPCFGDAGLLRELRLYWPKAHIVAMDKDDTCLGAARTHANWAFKRDFLRHSFDSDAKFDLIVTNPPFSFAREFIEKSLTVADRVVMLVRQGFMSSVERSAFFRENPPAYVYLLPNRPSFRLPEWATDYEGWEDPGNWGGDSADYCWMEWDQASDFNLTHLRWLRPVSKELRSGG